MQLFNLNGKVKFYLLKRYKLKFGLFKTTKQILDSSDSVLFTNKGENISFISKDSNGRIDMKVFSKYDVFGISSFQFMIIRVRKYLKKINMVKMIILNLFRNSIIMIQEK